MGFLIFGELPYELLSILVLFRGPLTVDIKVLL